MANFSSEDEKKVFDELTKIDAQLGQIYYSGLAVLRQKTPTQTRVIQNPLSETTLDDKDSQGGSDPYENVIEENPDRIAQSAHSMRETLNVTFRHPKIIQSTTDLTLKTKVQKLTDPHIGLPIFLQFPYEQLTKLHGWFTKVSHHSSDPPSEQEYLTKVREFTALMCHILTPHYEVIQEIDKFIEKPNPGKDDLEELEFLMSKNTQSYYYFFKKAKSNWLQALVADGKYFKKIPSVIKNENSYSYPFWPESFYLENIASEKPESVEKIISQIQIPKKNFERNSVVLENFVSAAIKMPPQIGKLIAKRAIKKKWHGAMLTVLPERSLTGLMLNLVDTEFETALDLCDVLLDVTIVDSITSEFSGISRKDIRPVIDNHVFEEILKNDIPKLSEKNNDGVLKMLAKKLSKANFLANKLYEDSSEDPKQDISFVWRPAIEEHEQNHGFDLRSDLVATICIILAKSESIGITTLKKSLALLKDQDYYIFRRLEIYFFGRHPLEFSDEVNKLSIECHGKGEFKHEYYHMLKNSYPYLKSETREKLLNIISKGPDFDDYNGTREEFKTYKKHWRIEKLSPIIEHLPDLQKEYDSLVKKYGKSVLAEFVSYREPISQVTYPSDLTEGMSTSEVMDFIKSYKTPQGMFLEEDGSGRMLKEFVEKKPEEYSKHAMELTSCHGVFQFRFLDGLSQIKDKILDWNSILNFCEHVIITSPPSEPKVMNSILGYFGNFLENNLTHDETAIPFDLRDRVWKILEKAIEIAPPDTARSENYPNENRNAVTVSINSSIGRLAHALMQYAVWCYFGIKDEGILPTELIPEVKTLLESKLDPDQEQSISVHAVLGFHFHNLLALDEEWTKSKINLIFNHDKPHVKAGDAAWDSYTEQQVYRKSFTTLFDEYLYRISLIGTESTLRGVQKRLTRQVALICFNDLDRSNELFESFLEKSDSELLDEYLGWLVQALRNWKDKDPPKINVSKIASYKKIRSNPSAGWLFLNPLMSKSERIELLNSILNETQGEISPTYDVSKEMEEFVDEFPLQTITCIDKIIRHYKTDAKMHLMLSKFKNIFQKIPETGNKPAIEKMNGVVNFLGSLGYDEFRKFLN